MTRPFISTLLFVVSGALLLQATGCKKDPDLSQNPAAVNFYVPEGWPQPVYQFEHNPLTRDGFELGRLIFNDTRLSRDNSTSCGTCHQPFAAFAQSDHIFSHGVDGLVGTRNSPGIFNLAWHPSFFWDGGVNHIESQPLSPIENPVEMDEKLDNIIAKLTEDKDYRQRFKKVFGTEEITTQRIMRALTQFMGAMISDDAPYDKYMRGQYAFTPQEISGMSVFEGSCAHCHKPPLFSDFSFRNNGLPVSGINDSGRAHITQQAEDLYKFKVPTLRNLRFTPPYMHDGRFATLDQVLAHYKTGIVVSPTLDPLLSTGGINLSEQEKEDLKAFLNTLNDESFVTDPRFAEP